jgi:hypothetical protein
MINFCRNILNRISGYLRKRKREKIVTLLLKNKAGINNHCQDVVAYSKYIIEYINQD